MVYSPNPNSLDPIALILDVFANDIRVSGYEKFGAVLGQGYDPENDRPALVVTVKAGQTHSEMPTAKFQMQVTAWAGINQFALARRASYDAWTAVRDIQNVDYGADGFIITLYETTPGQQVTDPDTGWATVISTYELQARSN